MSGTADDWGTGGRHVRQADGRRTRRSDGRRARPHRPEDEQSSEFSLPVAPDLDEDDPKTLAEDAQWAAKLRPGRAPSAGGPGPPAPAEDGPDPATSADDLWAPATATPPPSTGGDPWDGSPSDGSGEFWRSSAGGSAGDHTGEPWAPAPAATSGDDLWAASPADGGSTADWTAPGGAFEPEPTASDWSPGEQPSFPAAAGDPGTGSWAGIAGTSAGWEPDGGAWSPEPPARPPWEPDPPSAPPASQPFQAAAAEPPPARPWEAQPPLAPEPASFPATEPSASSGTDFGALFGELARDRQAEAPAAQAPTPTARDQALHHDDPAVQAAHAEARRLIEEATGQWLWDDDKPSRTGEIAAPAATYGSSPGQGLPQAGPPTGTGLGSPSAFGVGGQDPGAAAGGYGPPGATGPGGGPRHAAPAPSGAPGWSDPLPPPPVPDTSAPFGSGISFAPPGSAPTEVGPSATPPPASRELSHTRGPGRHEQPDEPGSRLWAPDRRADEEDASGGVGWLWSVEEYGASPPVPGSWLREPPRPQVHDVDGLARPIEGRGLRQLESRSHGRRVRRGRRWPFRVAVAAWIVLFAVVCWLYVFPWLEGVLPENF
jgi:hypothetical protein